MALFNDALGVNITDDAFHYIIRSLTKDKDNIRDDNPNDTTDATAVDSYNDSDATAVGSYRDNDPDATAVSSYRSNHSDTTAVGSYNDSSVHQESKCHRLFRQSHSFLILARPRQNVQVHQRNYHQR